MKLILQYRILILNSALICTLGCSAVFSAKTQVLIQLSEINSPYDEQHPVISPAGNLYFTRAFHPENQNGRGDLGDVWMALFKENEAFQGPTRVGELSTKGFDLVVGFLDHYNILIYHDGKEKKQGIHQYVLEGNSWNYKSQMDLGNFRNNSAHFSGRLSSSKDILILSYSSFGTYGNEDIYVSFLKENGNWSVPKNLGPLINTFQQEITPSISTDSRMLYFSTNGHGSMGGIDIFYSERLDDSWENWTTPKQLSSVNSIGAELSYFQLLEDPGTALLTTTQNSEGYGDIWIGKAGDSIIKEKENIQEEIAVTDIFMEPTQENIQLPVQKPKEEDPDLNVPSGKKEGIKESFSSEENKVEKTIDQLNISGTESGVNFTLRVLDMHSLSPVNYSVSLANSSGFLAEKIDNGVSGQNLTIDTAMMKRMVVSATGYLPLTLNVNDLNYPIDTLKLIPASKGVSMVLEQVFFKRGTAEYLDEKHLGVISNLAVFLVENPNIKILLEGHTDNLGNAQLNKELSLNRASAVRKSLMDFGVEFERIRIAGWGGAQPLDSNQTEKGRIKNRRVEMVIVDH